MNAKNTLKVNVNGSKYLITGIKPSTSCKDLLCALAKATQQPINDKINYKNEKSIKQLYNIEKNDENLIEKFKNNLQDVGDFESYKVLNNLSKNVCITKRTKSFDKYEKQEKNEKYGKHDKYMKHERHEKYTNPEQFEKFEKRQYSRKEKRYKKVDETEKPKNKERKTRKSSNEKKSKTIYEEYDSIYERKTRKRIVKRSLDDSDIDNYRDEKILRYRKRRSRVFDDSDLDVYKSLFSLVLDQTKHIAKIEREKRNVQKAEWIKELHRNSQVYYVDKTMEEALAHYEKDNDNDSGLPSPEYDSSMESNPPIKTPELLKKSSDFKCHVIKSFDQSNDLKMNSEENDRKSFTEIDGSRDFLFENDMQTKDFLKNESSDNNNNNSNDTLQNECDIKTNDCNNLQNECNMTEVFLNNKTYKNHFEKKLSADGSQQTNEKEKSNNLFICKREEENIEEYKDIKTVMRTTNEQCNKNIFNTNNEYKILQENYCGRNSSQDKMVAFEAVLNRKSQVENKKLDKKKISKRDISNPVLLSPSAFKKHKVLLNVERSLYINDNDVLDDDNDVVVDDDLNKQTKQRTIQRFDEDKIKSFNKKIKDLKKKHKNKSNKDAKGKENNISSGKENKENEKTEKITNNKNENFDTKINENMSDHETLKINDESNVVSENKDLSNENNDSSMQSSNGVLHQSNEEILEREKLLYQYEEEKKLLDEIIIQVIEYNLYIADLNEQIQTISSQNTTLESLDDETCELDDEEASIYSEIESVQTLLRTVTDITTQQKGEMSKNLALLDKLDIEVKGRKAGLLNLQHGKINYLAAPRPLLNRTRKKTGDEKSTSFV